MTVGLGFTANAVNATEAITKAGFWEIGYFQTPGGPPSAAPASEGSDYGRIARSQEARALLGRSTNIQGWANDIPAQTAVGLIDYRDGAANVTSRIPADLRPQSNSSVWKIACCIMGYVDGNSAVAAINRHAAILRQTDEKTRFAALARAVAQDVEAGRDASGHYPIVRTMQRLAVAQAVAVAIRANTSWWYTPGDEKAIEHWITIPKYGQPTNPSCVPASTSLSGLTTTSSSSSGTVVITGLAILITGLVGYSLWKNGHLERFGIGPIAS